MIKEIKRYENLLKKAEAEVLGWSRHRGALPPGSSRARVTTANARWSAAAENRDFLARKLDELKKVRP